MKKSYGTWFGFGKPLTGQRTIPIRYEDESEIKDAPRPTFCDNSVVTAKYNLITFIPRILMLLGTYTTWFDTPVSPWSTLATLIIVLLVSMTKEAVEDYKRHKADNKTNSQKTERVPRIGQTYDEIKWWEVKVGNIIRVKNNEEIPADMILLTTSELYHTAFIETANIDGETNLKIKQSVKIGKDDPAWNEDFLHQLKRATISLKYEQPNSVIHHFHGSMFLNDKEIGLDASNLLLRGSTLRNTKWVYGVVVYTGKETKLVMNSRAAPSKLSYIEQTMNTLIYVIFAAQILISLISLITFIVWKDENWSTLYYLCYNYDNSSNSLWETFCDSTSDYTDAGYFFTFFILYNNFIPISLYVTVEVVNYMQAYFIDQDLQMYEGRSNTPAVARTSNMNSDLGMIEYIFSDKTGTLTDNVMRFRRCSVAGTVYGDPPEDDTTLSSAAEINFLKEQRAKNSIAGRPLTHVHRGSGLGGTPLAEFSLVLALCHTVIIEEGELQSESPDEEALVKATKELGWEFVGRRPGVVMVEREGQRMEYELLATIPFDSTRKRMSVVVRSPEGKIIVYCKGADNIIFERSTAWVPAEHNKGSEDSRAILNKHLNVFASDGLRTLILAKRELNATEYRAFSTKWDAAEKAIAGRDDMMKEAAALVECELTVLGATAIEDKLQKGVPQTIQDLRNAGIKVWVCTGDKMETAINIGYSSRLLVSTMVLIRLKEKHDGISIRRKLQALLNHFDRLTENKSDIQRNWLALHKVIYKGFSNLFNAGKSKSEPGYASDSDTESIQHKRFLFDMIENPDDLPATRGHHHEEEALVDRTRALTLHQIESDHLALVVDGDSLIKIFGDVACEQMFLTLSQMCRSVIACRVSPEQKRLLVRLVKRGVHPAPVTLSIGDGANDVAMIQEAQVGIGISGKEGRQAVNNSDFAIAQFRYLKRLLLIHGRLDYRRTSKVVLYSFYKNIVLTIILFLFEFFCGYSGQSLFEDNIYSAYNIILALPVIAFGVFDRDISVKTLNTYSFLYVTGRRREDLNVLNILQDMGQALADGCILFFLPYYCYYSAADIWTISKGYSAGLWVFGTTVYTCLVVSMFIRCAMQTKTWTWLSHVFYWGSLILYFIFVVAYQYMYTISFNFYGVANEMMSQSLFWALLAVVCSASAFLELSIRWGKKEFSPTLVDIATEYDQRGPEDLTAVTEETGAVIASSEIEDGAPEEGLVSEDVASAIQYSSVMAAPGEPPKVPLDWQSIKSLFSSLSPAEQARLGVHNTEDSAALDGSAYNYDHVSQSYGPGAGLIASHLSQPHHRHKDDASKSFNTSSSPDVRDDDDQSV